MALKIFKNNESLVAFSSDYTYDNPILWLTSPTGGILEQRVYLRMEEPYVEYCTQGRLYAVDATGEDETAWFEFAEEDNGGPGEYGPEVTFEIPLGSGVYVWVKLTVPEALEQKPKDDVRITASYIRHLADE